MDTDDAHASQSTRYFRSLIDNGKKHPANNGRDSMHTTIRSKRTPVKKLVNTSFSASRLSFRHLIREIFDDGATSVVKGYRSI